MVCFLSSDTTEHWLTQSVEILPSPSKLTTTAYQLDCSQSTGLQQYTVVSPLSPRDASSGFPSYNLACFLGVRIVKTTGECTGQVNQKMSTASRFPLPVDYPCPAHTVPVLSPTNTSVQVANRACVKTGRVYASWDPAIFEIFGISVRCGPVPVRTQKYSLL